MIQLSWYPAVVYRSNGRDNFHASAILRAPHAFRAFNSAGGQMRVLTNGLEKSASDLLAQASDAFDVAKTQRAAAETEHDSAARQHRSADEQHEIAEQQHEIADKQDENAVKQTESAEKLDISADKLDTLGRALIAEAVEVRGAADALTGRSVRPESE